MRSPDWLCAALATVLTWVVFSPYALVAVDFHHDGNVAKPALDVATGQIPFRDTIVVYGTLSTWLQAEAMRWFGPNDSTSVCFESAFTAADFRVIDDPAKFKAKSP